MSYVLFLLLDVLDLAAVGVDFRCSCLELFLDLLVVLFDLVDFYGDLKGRRFLYLFVEFLDSFLVILIAAFLDDFFSEFLQQTNLQVALFLLDDFDVFHFLSGEFPVSVVRGFLQLLSQLLVSG